ncbi:hypothetical protein ASA1KI_23660 [Opitutales bacterium ASA1]|nr:hypothetical protein ASA1KI_23660 [Opitutales bacterium ASA1]
MLGTVSIGSEVGAQYESHPVGSSSVWRSERREAPFYPLRLEVKVGEAWRQVTGYDGKRPTVGSSAAREVVKHSKPEFKIGAGEGFTDGVVWVEGSWKFLEQSVRAETQPPVVTARDTTLTVWPDRDLRDCFLVVAVWDLGRLIDESGEPRIAAIEVRPLRELVAQRKVKQRVSLPKHIPAAHLQWAVLVFSQGNQVLTVGESAGRLHGFFDLAAIAAAEKATRMRAATGRSFSPEIVRRLPIVPPQDTDPKWFGREIRLYADVSAQGTIVRISCADVDDPALSNYLQEAVGAWVFAPKVVSGFVIPSTVVVKVTLPERTSPALPPPGQ